MRSSSHNGGPDGSATDNQTEERTGHLRHSANRLDIIGLGSGGTDGLTITAKKALSEAGTAIGYKLYLDQAEPWLSKETVRKASGMTKETQRAEEAIDLALSGVVTAVVSGGDPGVYAMAGAVFEVASARGLDLGKGPGQLDIRVIPGVAALTAAAALLGAPLTHDFCAISLSDRLTDWQLICRRLDLASQADFVIAIYNPKSHGRDWQLGEAADILLKNLPAKTPVGLASRCGREGESTSIITLDQLKDAPVDMQTLVIIGNSSTFIYQNHMITPRGYVKKYGKSA